MIKIYRLNDDAIMPSLGTEGAAGYDLRSTEIAFIEAGTRAVINTGISIEMPPSVVGLIRPRSGLAVKHGIDVLAGVIDSDYRGEIKVVLLNTGAHMVEIEKGQAIAQILFIPVIHEVIEANGPISETSRGNGGFGSTDAN